MIFGNGKIEWNWERENGFFFVNNMYYWFGIKWYDYFDFWVKGLFKIIMREWVVNWGMGCKLVI